MIEYPSEFVTDSPAGSEWETGRDLFPVAEETSMGIDWSTNQIVKLPPGYISTSRAGSDWMTSRDLFPLIEELPGGINWSTAHNLDLEEIET